METLEKRKTRRPARIYQPIIPRFKSLDAFLEWSPEGDYKYEWIDGRIEPTERMKRNERYSVNNLIHRFLDTEAFKQGGMLAAEGDMYLTETNYRRPDAAYFTRDQIRAGAENTDVSAASFVIELISPTDREAYLARKITDYFAAGVQVLWYVYPNRQQVFVYRSPQDILPCTRPDDLCSAAPALPDFAVTVEELFRLP